MSKFYDVYAKEKGSWVRKGKSEGGSTLPEYDGTVIIEKANSVLGLRKLKENVEALSHEDLGTIRFTKNGESYLEFYNGMHINIEPITFPNGYTVYGITPLYAFPDYFEDGIPYNEENFFVVGLSENVEEGTVLAATLDEFNAFVSEFNILSYPETDDFTLITEWLLANTEGVSV